MKRAEAESVDGNFYRVVARPKGAPWQIDRGSLLLAQADGSRLRLYLFDDSGQDAFYTVKDIRDLRDASKFVPHHWPVPEVGAHFIYDGLKRIRYVVQGVSGSYVHLVQYGGRKRIQARIWELGPETSLKPAALPFATRVRITGHKTRDLNYRLRVKPKAVMPTRTPTGQPIVLVGDPRLRFIHENFSDHFFRKGRW